MAPHEGKASLGGEGVWKMAKEATPKRAVAKTRPRVGGGLLRKIATKRGEVETPPPSTRGGAPEKKGKNEATLGKAA